MDSKQAVFLKLNQRQWQRILLAFLISLIGLVLRVNLALNGPVEYDEPVYVDAALLYSRAFRAGNLGGALHSDYNYEHPIFYKLVYAAALGTPPDGGISMPFDVEIIKLEGFGKLFNLRLVSVFWGSAAVFFLSLVNPLAGLMLAVHTFAVKYTSVIYLEALPLWANLFSVWCFSHYVEAIKAKQEGQKTARIWLALSAVSLGMAAASKYLYALAGLAVVIYFLFFWLPKSKRHWLAIIAWGSVALLFFVVCDPFLWSNPGGQLLKSLGFHLNYSQKDAVVVAKNYPFWQPLVWLSLSIPQHSTALLPFFVHQTNFWIVLDSFFVPLAVTGLWRLWKDYPIYFIWLVTGVITLLLWSTKWPQYILMILVPYCLSAALGGELVYARMRWWGEKLYERLSHRAGDYGNKID
jgi:hypothetical protein